MTTVYGSITPQGAELNSSGGVSANVNILTSIPIDVNNALLTGSPLGGVTLASMTAAPVQATERYNAVMVQFSADNTGFFYSASNQLVGANTKINGVRVGGGAKVSGIDFFGNDNYGANSTWLFDLSYFHDMLWSGTTAGTINVKLCNVDFAPLYKTALALLPVFSSYVTLGASASDTAYGIYAKVLCLTGTATLTDIYSGTVLTLNAGESYEFPVLPNGGQHALTTVQTGVSSSAKIQRTEYYRGF